MIRTRRVLLPMLALHLASPVSADIALIKQSSTTVCLTVAVLRFRWEE